MSEEEKLISLIGKKYGLFGRKENVFGIGDDCSVISAPNNSKYVITCDLLCEDTHFSKDFITPYELGRKAAAVNISDVAGMGGRPLYVFVSLGIPTADTEYIEELYKGMYDCLSENNTLICGGDTVKSKKLTINITVIGEAENPIYRSGAKIGDALMLCGTPGASAAGLEVLLSMGRAEGEKRYFDLIQKHLLPKPIMCSPCLGGKAHSMMDTSDGIFKDLNTLCTASGVGALVKETFLPISDSVKQFCKDTDQNETDFVLSGGEDYGLLFTCSEKDYKDCIRLMAENNVNCCKIGEIIEGSEAVLMDKNGNIKAMPSGWQHF